MKNTQELVMEPHPRVGTAQQSAATLLKSILFVVHDDDALETRLQAALSLARTCSAHLHLLQVVPVEAYTVVDAYGGAFVSGEIVEALEDQAAKVRTRLETHLNKEDVSWTYEVATSPMLPELLRSSALADMVIIGRQPHWREFNHTGPGLLGALVCNTRSLLCIPGDGREVMDPFGTAIIAWNGSVEAANAVRASVGLLRMARDVRVVRYTENKEVAFPDTRLMEYLSRHGISAVLDSRAVSTDYAADLIEYARVFSAEYLVMGGYSHNRAGEFLFGGVTRELLHESPVSLVMAH